jgi:hypothetical protein
MKRPVIYAAIILVVILLLFIVCQRHKPQVLQNLKHIENIVKEAVKSPMKKPALNEARGYVIKLPQHGEKTGQYNFSIYIIRADAYGNTKWARTYSTGNDDWADAVYCIDGGGAVIAARSYSPDDGYLGMYILKIGADGEKISMQWIKDMKDGDFREKSGGFVLTAGRAATDGDLGGAYIAATGKDGAYEWIRNFGAGYFDWGYTSIWGSDGRFVTISRDDNPPQDTEPEPDADNNLIITRSDDKGGSDWSRKFRGDKFDEGYSLSPVGSGGFIATGLAYPSVEGNDSACIMRLDKNGMKIWENYYGKEGHERAYDAVEARDNGFIAAGTTDSMGAGGYDAFIFKTDSSGKMLWEKTYGGAFDDTVHSLAVTGDGGFIAVGATDSFLPEKL